jgi:hypothetical protein
MDERLRAVMGGELIKLRDQWLQHPAEISHVAGVMNFVDFCVATLNSGTELGLMVHEHAKTKDIFGR